jgi:hypothetical protein
MVSGFRANSRFKKLYFRSVVSDNQLFKAIKKIITFKVLTKLLLSGKAKIDIKKLH